MVEAQQQSNNVPRGVTVCVYIQKSAEAKGATRSIVTCFRCGETGHYRAECHHWRIHMCAKGAACADANCSGAHGPDELRRPWMPKCVRVVKQGNAIEILGCGRVGHTFRMCPHHHHSAATVRASAASNVIE